MKIDPGSEKAAVLGSRVAPEAAAQSTPTAFLSDFQLLPVEQVSGSFEKLGRLEEGPELEALTKKVEETL